MSAEEDVGLHLPHDKLFAATFSVPANAAAFLQPHLPEAVSRAIDWSRLETLPGTFVDSHYRRSHTDLLFSAPLGEREGLIYVLLEHQSTPDVTLPLRLLRYITRIWEQCAKEQPPGAKLPVVLPIVLSQNAEVWEVPTRLSALLAVPSTLADVLAPFIPDFEYRHVQLADLPFRGIPGTPSGILVLRVMKAERLHELLDDSVWDEALIEQTPLHLWQMILRYMLSADVDRGGFERKVSGLVNPDTRRNAMTLAQQYRQAGRQEGAAEGSPGGDPRSAHAALWCSACGARRGRHRR